ncbi:MAG: ROK family transcriptional regulator [Spirochaetia bacterium]|nr:ROK family transcriptional regulator [Spirochaetia bacterium]
MNNKRSFNQSALKQNNIGVVLDEIKRKKSIVKSELSRKLRLSFSTVSNICETLQEQGLINMDSVGDSTGGRKPKSILFQPFSKYIISLDFSVEQALHISIVNLDYKVILNEWLSGIYSLPLEEMLTKIKETVIRIAISAGVDKESIIGAGVAVPGMYDKHLDTIFYSTNSSLANIRLRKRLEDALKVPVTILNDANLAALGQCVLAAQPKSNLLLVYFTEGIGLGIIYNGDIYYGAKGFAGEIGNVRVPLEKGSWKIEKLLNLSGILKNYSFYLINGRMGTAQEIEDIQEDEEYLFQQLLKGCLEKASCELAFMEQIGNLLGWLISAIIDLMNPDTVYIGGNIDKLVPCLIPHVSEYVRKNSIISPIMDVSIEAASVENLIVIGTGELVYKEWMYRTFSF